MRSAFVDLYLQRYSPVGIFLAFYAVILGFALIWRICWLAGLHLPADEVTLAHHNHNMMPMDELIKMQR